jgi:hypothetical protein
MSLLIRLDKLNKDVTLSDQEKYNVFEELTHSFLSKSKFSDFKTLLNYYQFKEETLYHFLTRCIEQDKIMFVKHMTYNYKKSLQEGEGIYNIISIRLQDVKYSIKKNKIEILKYFLSQCSKNLITDDLIFDTSNKEILSIFIHYGVNPEPKFDIIIQKCSIMNKMCSYMHEWCSRGDTQSMVYLRSYIENHVNLCCINRLDDTSVKLLISLNDTLEKLIKKEYPHKGIFLQQFFQFLEQNNADDIARIHNILMSI